MSLSALARRLGVGQATLSRWLESPPEELAELRPVDLIDRDESATEQPRSGGA